MAPLKTRPHSKEDRCLISGTELRRMLSFEEMPPPEFSRPEVLEILIDYCKGLKSGKAKERGKNR
jgi:sulfate adenylyltransferase